MSEELSSDKELKRKKADQLPLDQQVGRGGALVETMTFNRRVVGSTPALAVT